MTDITIASVSEHSAVLERAMAIYGQRSARYNDLWRNNGYLGSLFNVRACVDRAWHVLWLKRRDPTPKDVDNLLDCINYCVFAIRNIERDNPSGTWKI